MFREMQQIYYLEIIARAILVERIDPLRINPSAHFTGETETIFQSHFDADWMKCSSEPRREEKRGLYN